ncbi:VOC family protein [Wenxinia saemankumensis]|uniref:Catechol 2,3-dioxygenase n=1 Tax=Wenxinia saemankumensis TaxID=1447782 RepID=A0A1M6E4E5_9RHOB|nr:VOC family protein [Wenxinia saemankumensis]SHI80414.1 Catechol 2,3-dioxygenase [Wenxinia saemankumensis]
MILGLDHVQLAMPEGGEDAARAFFVGLLGMAEVEKPAALAGRGGLWLRGGDAVLHLGVEAPFAPARKAHPAFVVGALDEVRARLEAAGLAVRPDADLPGIRRVFVEDPFGNRIELLERARD